jgi:metallo-beta-lactamase family protein
VKFSSKPCGDYQTNCYVISKNGREIIIDPGQDSYDFVVKNSHAPLTILNTHGHFDHVLDNVSLKNFFNVPVYIHKDDNFMLHDDLWDAGQQPMYDAICVGGAKFEDVKFNIEDFEIEFMHFPGHTPGCCMVRVDNVIFSGDFLFRGSIGRYDFPFSNAEDMRQSLLKCKNLQGDFILYPGHGDKTTLKAEHANLDFWIHMLENRQDLTR